MKNGIPYKNIYNIIKERWENNNFKERLTLFNFLHWELDNQKSISLNDIEKEYWFLPENIYHFLLWLEITYLVALVCICEVKFLWEKDSKSFNQVIKKVKLNGIINYETNPLYTEYIKYIWIDAYQQIKEFTHDFLINIEENIIQNLFELIFNSKIRHSLWEFFTPNWICDYIGNDLIQKESRESYLDPTCWSGNFLISLINNKNNIDFDIYWVEINPLSSFAAKTNLLINNFLWNNGQHWFLPVIESDIMAWYYEESSKKDKTNQNFLEYINKYPTDNSDRKSKNIKLLWLLPKVDYILWNPPRVNREYLPNQYREKTKDIWKKYNLFDVEGLDHIFIKEDISCLITYYVIDNFLKENWELYFILKESILKSNKQWAWFRKFFYTVNNKKIDIGLCKYINLSKIKTFDWITVNPIIIWLKKWCLTSYPVKWEVWKKDKTDKKLLWRNENTIEKQDIYINMTPNDRYNTIYYTKLQETQKSNLFGKNKYRARTWVFCGWANWIFQVEIIEDLGDYLKIRNLWESWKNKFKTIEHKIEKKFIFPLFWGSDIQWYNIKASRYIIFPHTIESKMYPINFDVLKKFPYTESYFDFFKYELENRKWFTSIDKKIAQEYYYTLQRIWEYTFSKYKVCRKYISSSFNALVVSNNTDKYLWEKLMIPNEKIIYIDFDNIDEAYFVCGFLNSNIVKEYINWSTTNTSTPPSCINNINIPLYNGNDKIHQLVKKTSHAIHEEWKINDKLQKELNENVAKILEVNNSHTSL